jgi:perosamine synthetase
VIIDNKQSYFKGVVKMDSKQIKSGDASGRVAVEGYKINPSPMITPYTQKQIDAVVKVMSKVQGQTQGPVMQEFEEKFKEYTGANHAFAVDNATNALRLSAILCRLEPGNEVIISSYTFCASAIPFGNTGAKIVWADIDPETWVANPEDIERKITDKTKVLVVVHLLGMPVNMPAIMELAEKHKLRVVEDCAQSPGSSINGRKVGTFGDFGCFSFHGAKNMTTLGEGGMLTVRKNDDAKLIEKLRHNGCCAWTYERERYWVPAMGNVDVDQEMEIWPNNFCIGEAACACGIEALKMLDKANDVLIAQRDKIRDIMSGTPEISFAKEPEGYKHIVHQFIMHFDGSGFGKDRNDLLDIMTEKYKIRCIVQYYPLYRYDLFKKLGAGEHDCPVLEKWWDNSFSFPWWCGMDDGTLDYLVSSLKMAIAILKEK